MKGKKELAGRFFIWHINGGQSKVYTQFQCKPTYFSPVLFMDLRPNSEEVIWPLKAKKANICFG